MTAAQNIPQLFTGYKWSTTTVSYTFITDYALYTPQAEREPGGLTVLSPAQQAATRQLFADIQSFLGVQFVEVPQDNTQETIGQIAIGMRSTLGNPGWVAQTESNLTRLGDGGDIWLKTASYGNGLADDEFLNTMLHEIGHALGLKHPEIGGVENTARYTVDTQIRNSPDDVTTLLRRSWQRARVG